MTTDKSLSQADAALGDALCGKLRELAAAPPTPRSLMQLEQTARLAREILVAATDPFALRSAWPPGVFGTIATPIQTSGLDLPLPSSSTLAPSSYLENFGADALRQLVGKQSMAEKVAAIALAREKGLHELADKLERSLTGEQEPDKPAEIGKEAAQ